MAPTHGSEILAENQWTRFVKQRFALNNGYEGEYLIVERPVALMIIPLIEIDEELTTYLVRQHRLPIDEWIWQFPMGALEEGVAPEIQARAELHQETGLQADTLTCIADFFVDPGLSRQRCMVFVAENIHITKSQNLDETEAGLECREVRLDEVHTLLTEGTQIDSWGLSGMFLVQRYIKHNPTAGLSRDTALKTLLHQAEKLKTLVDPQAYIAEYELEIYDDMEWIYEEWQAWHAHLNPLLTPQEQSSLKQLESAVTYTPEDIWWVFFDTILPDGREMPDDHECPDIMLDDGFYNGLLPLLDLECRFIERLISTNAQKIMIDSDAIRVAELFHTRQRTYIDKLFIAHGAKPEWWTTPQLKHHTLSGSQVIGWIEGITQHAPDQLINILKAVVQQIGYKLERFVYLP